jgi:hypothetical protein
MKTAIPGFGLPTSKTAPQDHGGRGGNDRNERENERENERNDR